MMGDELEEHLWLHPGLKTDKFANRNLLRAHAEVGRYLEMIPAISEWSGQVNGANATSPAHDICIVWRLLNIDLNSDGMSAVPKHQWPAKS
jgi:hypothetical protein